jgi:hypothetical protein
MAIDKGRVGSRERQVVISAHVGEGLGGVGVYRAVRKLLYIPPLCDQYSCGEVYCTGSNYPKTPGGGGGGG